VFVVATAGHVDHGKSTLVRALTGTDPDRLAEEHRRGLTIELGYAWTELPTGERVEFVDVPGHEKFLATMLAGVGPVPAVLLVVAADEGWRRQTTEHVAALNALGVTHGLVAISRADRADPKAAIDQVSEQLAGTSLAGSPVVVVSAVTGAGIDDLRTALGVLVRGLPEPPPAWRTRLFVDRVFTIRGAGTVVTATLSAGSVQVGDVLSAGPRAEPVTVRALESCKESLPRVDAVARVALNLRNPPADLRHGDALRTPGAWPDTTEADVELAVVDDGRLPGELVLHVGSASVPVRVRVLAGSEGRFARLSWDRPLPLEPGDRGVLRNPGRHSVAAGIAIRDVDPPPLVARGAARARSIELAAHGGPVAEVRRRGLVRRDRLVQLGVLEPGVIPDGIREVGDWLVDPTAWAKLAHRLEDLVAEAAGVDRLGRGLPLAEAAAALELPHPALLGPLAADAGLKLRDGRLLSPTAAGPRIPDQLVAPLAALTARLRKQPFAAPEAADLTALRLAPKDLGALAALGVILRLPGDVVLLPDAPEQAADALRGIDQPFTLSEARRALATTRRVAVPLLEHLDRLRLTVRDPDSRRRTPERMPGGDSPAGNTRGVHDTRRL
jgi:selenocysteine-specific elongation factor